MRQQLLDLYEIQKIDLGIRELERQRQEIPKRLNELEGRCNAAKTELTSLTEQSAVLAQQVKTLENGVKEENDKIRKWEKRLIDIRNQREFMALQREVEGGKRANREAEEEILEHMAKKEALDEEAEKLRDRIAEDDVDGDTERQEVQAKLAAIEQEIAREAQRRDALLPTINKQLVRRYDSIRAKRLGVGLVLAEQGCCQGCNMRLPPQLFNILHRVDSIEQCPSCQRILIFADALVKEPVRQQVSP